MNLKLLFITGYICILFITAYSCTSQNKPMNKNIDTAIKNTKAAIKEMLNESRNYLNIEASAKEQGTSCKTC